MGAEESRLTTVATSEHSAEERISGLPIGKPVYLKSVEDPDMYLQVGNETIEGAPLSVDGYYKLRFHAKSRDSQDSSTWWLVEPISTWSFRLKHVESGFFVKCACSSEDPQGTLHLCSSIPWYGKNVLEFTAEREFGVDDYGPFRLECASTKVYNALDAGNKRASWIDGRLVDWPRVGLGIDGWLVGNIHKQRGEELREGGHIFLCDTAEARMVVTFSLQSSEDGHMCSCTTLGGEVIAQHKVASEDTLADIRSFLLTKLQERHYITGLVLVTSNGDVLESDKDSMAVLQLIS